MLLAGAVGLALVARAAAVYRGSDPLAFGMTLLIAAGLAIGTLELAMRAGRAARLGRELGGLPRPATEEAVARASAPLRAMLEARIAGAPSPGAPAPFASYLIGALVMVGLLGTFLGLFETLRGAREALTASGDVDALRSALGAPMQGLSRAFGTSAAGVSASAMLGLGALIVRRAEARFGAAFVAYSAGALSPITTAGRQLAALEAIARQGEARTAAEEALIARLARLEERLAAGQREAAREGAAAFAKAAGEVRGDIEAGVRRAAEATAAAVEPLAARVVERVGASAGEAIARIERRIDEDSAARREGDTAQLAAMRGAAERLAARAEADAGRDARIDALLDRLGEAARQMTAMAAAQAGRVEALAEAAEARAAAMAEAAEARAAALAEAADARTAEIQARADARAAEREALADARSAELHARADARAMEMDARADARAAAIAEGAQAAHVAQAARLAAFEERLEQARHEGAGALVAFGERIERMLTGAAGSITAFEERLELARRESAEALVAFEERLERARGDSAGALAERLSAHARGVAESLAATTAVVREAADLVRAGGAEMASVSEMFAGAVDRYREASE
ncbi:MAG: hypothetical protein IT372_16740, partial [Polyangiaceae bacterium]|nr:hypothetical protein [Polyangiaceae bacterium]